jgi:transposase-like protein
MREVFQPILQDGCASAEKPAQAYPSYYPHLVCGVGFCSTGRMSEVEKVKRRRRSRQEVQRLVAEFRTSGLRAGEFCRIHGLTHGTLQRGLRREQIGSGSQGGVKGLVAVELADGDVPSRRKPQEGRCGLEVILGKGRRIELSRDFDAVTLRRAIEVLEGS